MRNIRQDMAINFLGRNIYTADWHRNENLYHND